MGPTCAGKTAVAIELVQAFPCAIISVDSAMIYRGMDIGTAKPCAAELSRAPHRLIDIRDPAQSYSAAEFRADALRAIAEVEALGQVPLLVGGTGLYFRALEGGLSPLPPADPALRARLKQEAAAHGWPVLHRRLAALDPKAALRIHANDSQRIQRALEVHELTGVSMTAWRERRFARTLRQPVIKVVLSPSDRGELHRRANERFQRMLDAGFIEEVRALRDRDDLTADLPSIRVVGYRQVWQYLADGCGYEAMVRRAVAATRQLARRQLTWLRGESGAQWIDAARPGLPEAVAAFLRQKLHVSGLI